MIKTPIFRFFGMDEREEIPDEEYNSLIAQYPGIFDLWVQYKTYTDLAKNQENLETRLAEAQNEQQTAAEAVSKIQEINTLISFLETALSDPSLSIDKRIEYLQSKLTWQEKAGELSVSTADVSELETELLQATSAVSAAKTAINETLAAWGLEPIL